MYQYPDDLTGLRKCYLRALHTVSKDAALEAVSLSVKHTDDAKTKDILGWQQDSGAGRVYRLEQAHWVALTPKYYFDDAAYYEVVDFKVAVTYWNSLNSHSYHIFDREIKKESRLLAAALRSFLLAAELRSFLFVVEIRESNVSL